MKRLLLTAALLAAVAACEPEYTETAETAEAGGEHPAVTGGADPTTVSGHVERGGGTVHHPAADGNRGRPGDRRSKS